MIELCSKKRMISVVIVLGSLLILILLIENGISWRNEVREIRQIGSKNDSFGKCLEENEITVIEACRPCSPAEVNDSVCKTTMYMKKVLCVQNSDVKSIEVYKPCQKILWTEERGFWIFEALCLLLGISSYVIVGIRQRRLTQLLIDKVNKQIASGV